MGIADSTSVPATLRALREAAGVTQAELAERLGRRQPSLSRLERQGDARVSTLREYVVALGGELELIARVGDLETRLDQFDAAASVTDDARPIPTAPTLEYVRSRREEVLRVAERHGAYNVRVFGSVARGEATPESDIDLLIDMEEGRSAFEYVDLIRELGETLGRPVDVAEEPSLHRLMRERVLKEAVPL